MPAPAVLAQSAALGAALAFGRRALAGLHPLRIASFAGVAGIPLVATEVFRPKKSAPPHFFLIT
jgi:hypothetical protein